jgi:acyl-CoA reductase-like NAD-dependent aldehyde dehydrogenase
MMNPTQNSPALARLADAGRKNKTTLAALASSATAKILSGDKAADRLLRAGAESSRILERLGTGRNDR